MKEFTKRFLPLAFTFMLALSCISSVAMAIDDSGIETQALKKIVCARCGGTISCTQTRTYAHDESFECKHGKTGRDYYKVYEIKEAGTCPDCGYHYSYECDDHVFYRCDGV